MKKRTKGLLQMAGAFVIAPLLAEQTDARQVAPRSKGHQASGAFAPTPLTSLDRSIPNAGARGLNLAPVGEWNTEEITVIARRHVARHPTDDHATMAFGPVALTGSNKTDQIGFTGMTVTAAVPIPGVPGLAAVANLSGGHDAVNASNTRQSAALTAGFRLKF